MTTERILPSIKLAVEPTKRPISPGGEKILGEVFPILDHGFVYLVDYMGNDQSIEQAARVSYGTGTRKLSETRGLIRYLRRHLHTTPFEMVELKFHAKMPIFVARQWVRHRTASINEYSARYSILDKEFYLPEPEVLAGQSKSNRQGRGDVVPVEYAESVRNLLFDDANRNYEHYEYMLNDDGEGNPVDMDRPMIARELARMGLSLNFYTQWYWKVNLHNLFNFLNLRMDKHAQLEIQEYARPMGEITKEVVPIAWEAFEDYQLGATSLTRLDKEVLNLVIKEKDNITKERISELAKSIGVSNKREREEMVDKFVSLGLTS